MVWSSVMVRSKSNSCTAVDLYIFDVHTKIYSAMSLDRLRSAVSMDPLRTGIDERAWGLTESLKEARIEPNTLLASHLSRPGVRFRVHSKC